MRHLSIAGLACLGLLAGCSGGGGGGGETGRVTVQLIVPPAGSPDPLQGVVSFRIRVLDGQTVLAQRDFGANDSLEIPGFSQGTGRVVELEGYDAGDLRVSHGRTIPFDFLNGEEISLSMWFARSNSFNRVHGNDAARAGASAAMLSDGRVLIAGGFSGNSPVGTAQLFDWETDSVLPSGTMESPHAFARAVLLDPDTVLIAGGVNNAGLNATADADVFVYEPVSKAGSWAAAVPAMGTPRREAAAMALDAGIALLAGGDNGGPLDTTEYFQWSGTAGTWTGGPPLSVSRSAPIALEIGGGRGIVGGGYSGGGGVNSYSTTSDLFEWSGSAVTVSASSDFPARRAWPAVIPLSPDTWLLAGGLDNGGLLNGTEIVVLDGAGTGFSSSSGPPLPIPMRRSGGNVMPDGRTILVGGDDGLGFGPSPLDEAFVYDAASILDLGDTPGATSISQVFVLPDGSMLAITDGGARRYNPE